MPEVAGSTPVGRAKNFDAKFLLVKKTALALLLLLLLSFPCFAQKNEAAAYALGNFNPAYFAVSYGVIFAGDTTPGTGYGLGYSRKLTKHNALGIIAGTDIIDAQLYDGNNQFDVWSLRRYEVSIVAVQQFTHGGVTGFIFEGPGTIITVASPKLSGTSANLALTTGFGVDMPMTNHLSWQSRLSFVDSNPGCYGDRACHYASWSVAQDLWSGIAVRW